MGGCKYLFHHQKNKIGLSQTSCFVKNICITLEQTDQDEERPECCYGEGPLLGGGVAEGSLAGAGLPLAGDADLFVQVGEADHLEDRLDRDVERVGGDSGVARGLLDGMRAPRAQS